MLRVLTTFGRFLDQFAQVEPKQWAMSTFDSLYVPQISLENYMNTIGETACKLCCEGLSIQSVVHSFIYISRIAMHQSEFQIHKLNVHRLALTSLLIGMKYVEDRHCTNGQFARMARVEAAELMRLECEFLKVVDFNLWVDLEVYTSFSLTFLGRDCSLQPYSKAGEAESAPSDALITHPKTVSTRGDAIRQCLPSQVAAKVELVQSVDKNSWITA
jgi:hypothetical protein